MTTARWQRAVTIPVTYPTPMPHVTARELAELHWRERPCRDPLGMAKWEVKRRGGFKEVFALVLRKERP